VPRGGGAFADSTVNDGLCIQAGCRFDGSYLPTHHAKDRLLCVTDGPEAAISCSRAMTKNPRWPQDLCPRSSRIRPANDRETSRNDGNGWSIESAGQEPDSGIAAGSEIGPENTLKVETRVRTPLGLRRSEAISGLRGSEWPRIGPAAHRRPSRLGVR
jgi:hypothetical protein